MPPGRSGTVTATTSRMLATWPAALRTSRALSWSLTIMRTMPNSAVSASERVTMEMSAFASVRQMFAS